MDEIPILVFNSYTNADKSFQQLIGWSVSEGCTGRLLDLTLRSNVDDKTLWKVILSGRDMKLPTDKRLPTPAELHYYGTQVSGPEAVVVQVASADGTTITCSALLTAALETP
jgi:hypothetical protein